MVINLFIGSSRDIVSLRVCDGAGRKQLYELLRFSRERGQGCSRGDGGGMGACCGGAGGRKVPPAPGAGG